MFNFFGGGSAPEAPDPTKLAKQQTKANLSNALMNATLGNVNQVTPYGTLTYDQTGEEQIKGPGGKTYTVPKYTATTTLSDAQQAISDQKDAAELGLATAANQGAQQIGSILGTPFEYNPQAHMDWATGLYDDINGENLSRQQAALQTQLSNQGIKLGSEAYDRAMEGLRTSQGNSRNDFMLNSYGQGMQTALTNRNQPLNEMSALLSGSQVSQPNFINTNMPKIANTDVAGLEMAGYGNELNAWQQKRARGDAIMGGLFGLGASAISGGYI